MIVTVRSLTLGSLLLSCDPAAARQPGDPRQIDTPAPAHSQQEEVEVAARQLYVRSTVDGRVAVRTILPPGSRVVKDQLVCELDASGSMARLFDRGNARSRAFADHLAAKTALAVAEIDLKEYEESVYPHQLKQLERAVVVGKEMVALAEATLEAARRRSTDFPGDGNRATSFLATGSEDRDGDQPGRPDVGADVMRARFLLEMARLELEEVELKRQVLLKYAGPLRLVELRSALDRAKADLMSKNSTLELSHELEEHARRDLERHKVYAPADGVIEYQERRIGPDAVVRRGALLFVLHPVQPNGADSPTPGTEGPDRPLAEFLAKELGIRLILGGRPTDEEVEALSLKATDALGRPVTVADIGWFLDRLDRLRQPRLEGHEGLDRP